MHAYNYKGNVTGIPETGAQTSGKLCCTTHPTEAEEKGRAKNLHLKGTMEFSPQSFHPCIFKCPS